jgi:hypothetical protein
MLIEGGAVRVNTRGRGNNSIFFYKEIIAYLRLWFTWEKLGLPISNLTSFIKTNRSHLYAFHTILHA